MPGRISARISTGASKHHHMHHHRMRRASHLGKTRYLYKSPALYSLQLSVHEVNETRTKQSKHTTAACQTFGTTQNNVKNKEHQPRVALSLGTQPCRVVFLHGFQPAQANITTCTTTACGGVRRASHLGKTRYLYKSPALYSLQLSVHEVKQET